jgi:hypothetical protein
LVSEGNGGDDAEEMCEEGSVKGRKREARRTRGESEI